MPGLKSGYRARLFRAVHAEALKRRMDHDALHDEFARRFGHRSMGQCADNELLAVYKDWTGKVLRRTAALPKKGNRKSDNLVLVSAAELSDLSQEFALLEMSLRDQDGFIQRQLSGRTEVRTRGDYAAVLGGLRAMRKRRN